MDGIVGAMHQPCMRMRMRPRSTAGGVPHPARHTPRCTHTHTCMQWMHAPTCAQVRHKFNFVAASFVQSGDDVR
jgi:hypothetical protein